MARMAKLYRIQKGLSFRGAAKEIGLSHAAIKRFEDGHTLLTERFLVAYARLLERSIDEIMATIPEPVEVPA